MIKEMRYGEYNLYYCEECPQMLELGKDIVDKKELNIFQEFKVTQRNYVVGIEYSNEKYILKIPRNEQRIPQRKVQTLFKKGEAVTTLLNINNLIEMGFEEFSRPLLAGVRRKRGMIEESFLVMEYEEGRRIEVKDIEKVVEFGKKLHRVGHYHGDFNVSNFIMVGDKLKVIDTQGKKYSFGSYRKHYETLTFANDNFINEQKLDGLKLFNYQKDFWYYLAYFVKNFKNNGVMMKFRECKRKLRNKGWKI